MRRTLVSAAALSLLLASHSVAQQTTVLRAARLLDGTGAPTVTKAAIVVTGDHVTERVSFVMKGGVVYKGQGAEEAR